MPTTLKTTPATGADLSASGNGPTEAELAAFIPGYRPSQS
jgi:hypothetical protein